MSEKVVSSTGESQGTVQSQLLFTLYISSTTQSPVISRNTQMTLQLLGISVMEKRFQESKERKESTGNC